MWRLPDIYKSFLMPKHKFNIVTSTCVPLPYDNIDTDRIIPARFLKSTTREGFGENLFRDWRYDSDGNLRPDCPLNDPRYSGCILVAGKNFVGGMIGFNDTEGGLSQRTIIL